MKTELEVQPRVTYPYQYLDAELLKSQIDSNILSDDQQTISSGRNWPINTIN